MKRLVVLVGVLVAVWLCAAIAPASSQAFVGESLVIDPVTGNLTTAAKELIAKGKTMQEVIAEAKSFAGGGNVVEESAAAGVFESAGVLPTVAAAAASFTAGWEVGAEACEFLGFSGCIHFFGLFGTSGPTPNPNPTGGHWVYSKTAKFTGLPFAYYWEFNPEGSNRFEALIGTFTNSKGEKCEYWKEPGGRKFQGTKTGIGGACSSEGRTEYQYGFERSQMTDMGISGPAPDNPSVPNFSFTPEATATWTGKEGLPKRLKENAFGERVGQDIAHKISPSTVASPYGSFTVPSCEGKTAAACLETLEKLGLTPSVAYLNWPEAVVPEPNLNEPVLSLEAQAEKVQKLSPAAGTTVGPGDPVTITANPKLAGMPVIVPADPAPGESVSEYTAKRLAPQPGPTPTVVTEVLGETNESTQYNPSTVVRPSPKPGSRLNPESPSNVTVQVNPPTAPPVSAGTGTCGGSIGAIDWSPLNHSLGSKFPFGVFGFFVGWIGEWESGEGTPPKWSVTFVPKGVFGSKGLSTQINLGFMAPVVSVVRVVFLFASFVGLLWFLGTAAAKLQGDDS